MRALTLCWLKLVVVVSVRAAEWSSEHSTETEAQTWQEQPLLSKYSFDLSTYLQTRLPEKAGQLTGEELVDYVNKRQNLWKASIDNKFAGYTETEKRALMGVNHVQNSVFARRTQVNKPRHWHVKLPESFDAREQWGSICPSVKEIRDQSSCGSCWAFGAVEAMSDRVCIASKGQNRPTLSARDLLSCCSSCGFGCNGGDPFEAWSFWHTHGIVTGSNYTENKGCQPYPFAPCEHHSAKKHFSPCPSKIYHTPKCEHTCTTHYQREYNSDKYYGTEPFAIEAHEDAIKRELYMNGPLEITLDVYDDLLTYKNGIYVHQGGKLDGGHAVKLIGWGTENKVPYWIIANSWNMDWGEDGFFRILRGVNECGIESGVVGGLPDFQRSPSHQARPAIHMHKHQASSYDIF